MSNFWSDAEGKKLEKKDSFAGDSFQVIPKETNVLAIITEATLNEYEGETKIQLKWVIIKPQEYKNRIIFQKLAVWDVVPARSDRAKKMLVAIDVNAGGKLMESGKEPDDDSLAKALLNKRMVLKLNVWEMDGKKGNYVEAVAPATTQPSRQETIPADDDDEVPF